MRLAVFLFLILETCLLGPALAEETRQPKPLEHAYIGFALDLEDHNVCQKISPRALERAPFNSPGTQVYYSRSACFLYLAHRTLNPYFCREVRQAKSGFLQSGSHFSREKCEALVKSGQPFRASMGFDHELILRAMGYTEADLKDGSWSDFYHGFWRRNDGSMQHRVKNLPDFAKD